MTKHDQTNVTRPNNPRGESDLAGDQSGDRNQHASQQQGETGVREEWSPGREMEQQEGEGENGEGARADSDRTEAREWAPRSQESDGPRSGRDDDRRELPGSQNAPDALRTDGPRGLDWQDEQRVDPEIRHGGNEPRR